MQGLSPSSSALNQSESRRSKLVYRESASADMARQQTRRRSSVKTSQQRGSTRMNSTSSSPRSPVLDTSMSSAVDLSDNLLDMIQRGIGSIGQHMKVLREIEQHRPPSAAIPKPRAASAAAAPLSSTSSVRDKGGRAGQDEQTLLAAVTPMERHKFAPRTLDSSETSSDGEGTATEGASGHLENSETQSLVQNSGSASRLQTERPPLLERPTGREVKSENNTPTGAARPQSMGSTPLVHSMSTGNALSVGTGAEKGPGSPGPAIPPAALTDDDIAAMDQAIRVLTAGAQLYKHPFHGSKTSKPVLKDIWYDLRAGILMWAPRGGREKAKKIKDKNGDIKHSIKVKDIVRLSLGASEEAMLHRIGHGTNYPSRCFAVITPQRCLFLQGKSEDEAIRWFLAIQQISMSKPQYDRSSILSEREARDRIAHLKSDNIRLVLGLGRKPDF